jgi:hypothetical protein
MMNQNDGRVEPSGKDERGKREGEGEGDGMGCRTSKVEVESQVEAR